MQIRADLSIFISLGGFNNLKRKGNVKLSPARPVASGKQKQELTPPPKLVGIVYLKYGYRAA